MVGLIIDIVIMFVESRNSESGLLRPTFSLNTDYEVFPCCRTNAIPAKFRRITYCIGVANSVLESEWNTVYKRFTTASWGERDDLLNALSCSRNITILKRSVPITAFFSVTVEQSQ